jgi:hypothetical protein
VNGKVHLTPFWIPADGKLDRAGFRVSTPGGAGTHFRVGLYADAGRTPQGGKLLFDSGDQDATPAALVKDIAFGANVNVPAGYVWLAIETNDTVIVMTRVGNFLFFTDRGSEMLQGCYFTQAYGALPDPCPAVTRDNTAAIFGCLHVAQYIGPTK